MMVSNPSILSPGLLDPLPLIRLWLPVELEDAVSDVLVLPLTEFTVVFLLLVALLPLLRSLLDLVLCGGSLGGLFPPFSLSSI
jgi:hypothetical protein